MDRYMHVWMNGWMETCGQMDVLYYIFIVISRKLGICTEKQMSLPPPPPPPPPVLPTQVIYIFYNYNNNYIL